MRQRDLFSVRSCAAPQRSLSFRCTFTVTNLKNNSHRGHKRVGARWLQVFISLPRLAMIANIHNSIKTQEIHHKDSNRKLTQVYLRLG